MDVPCPNELSAGCSNYTEVNWGARLQAKPTSNDFQMAWTS